jgi:hypothetical protein
MQHPHQFLGLSYFLLQHEFCDTREALLCNNYSLWILMPSFVKIFEFLCSFLDFVSTLFTLLGKVYLKMWINGCSNWHINHSSKKVCYSLAVSNLLYMTWTLSKHNVKFFPPEDQSISHATPKSLEEMPKAQWWSKSFSETQRRNCRVI